MSAKIIAVVNQKGGVGKTTTACNLTRAAVAAGRRVLLLDCDPQGNATTALTAEEFEDDQAGLADVLSARADETIADVIVPGVWSGLDVVPTAGTALAAVRDELVVAQIGREARLRKALAQVRDNYDVIVIDTAPSIDSLTINALVAADAAAVVSECELFSLDGVVAVLGSIEQVRAHYNPGLVLGAILANGKPARSREADAGWAELQDAAAAQGWPLIPEPIPLRGFISSAVKNGEALDDLRGRDRTAAATVATTYTRLLTTIEGAIR